MIADVVFLSAFPWGEISLKAALLITMYERGKKSLVKKYKACSFHLQSSALQCQCNLLAKESFLLWGDRDSKILVSYEAHCMTLGKSMPLIYLNYHGGAAKMRTVKERKLDGRTGNAQGMQFYAAMIAPYFVNPGKQWVVFN